MSLTDTNRARRLLFLEASSFKPLAILRIGIAFVLLVQAQYLWRYRDLLMNEYGPVPWIISDRLLDPLLPRVSHIPTAFGAGAEPLVWALLLVHAVAAGLLLVGWATRKAAVAAWLSYLPLLYSGNLYFYGIGSMLLIGVFYCVFLPVGREWSLDARAGRAVSSDAALDASLSVAVLRIHLCIIYLAAGISKAVGAQWWTGDAVWRALTLPRFQQFEVQDLVAYPWAFQLLALGAVLVQLVYPVLVWTRLRPVIVLATELMHLGIAIFLGLWLFSAVMIVLNMAAFGESLWKALRRWAGKPEPLGAAS